MGKSWSFFPLKDASGTTQLVATQKAGDGNCLETISRIPTHSVVTVEGEVRRRPDNAVKPSLSTGEIEVHVDKVRVQNSPEPLPFNPFDTRNQANESLRMRYRQLDLRRQPFPQNLQKRSRCSKLIRDFLHGLDFTEVETPILLRSTPEGAREFLVPTRQSASDKSSGPLFYALQQSPQQLKQLLVCSGVVNKYFQFAKCFRDEDGRKDRQPEFTQIDLEMAFVSQTPPAYSKEHWRIGGQEVRETIEGLMREIWQYIEGVDIPISFPVLTYEESMLRFGSDKPDTRFGVEICRLSNNFVADQLALPIPPNHVVEALFIPPEHQFYRSAQRIPLNDENSIRRFEVDETNSYLWTTDMAHNRIARTPIPGKDDSDVDKYIDAGTQVLLALRPADLEGDSTSLGRTRLAIAEHAEKSCRYTPRSEPQFLWITEFPLFTRADPDKEFISRGRWNSTHHPFTAPMWEDMPALVNGRYGEVRGQHYDLVLNGAEIGGGSVRIHDPELQDTIFSSVLELTSDEKASFDHLMVSLRSGAPPHAGIAIGFDRLMAILCGTATIRDVIAFPKSTGGLELTLKAPSPIKDEVLQQYHLKPT